MLPAFGLLGAVTHGRRARVGFGLGTLFGLGFLLPLLRWTGTYVGPVPWLALSGAGRCSSGPPGPGSRRRRGCAARCAPLGRGGVGRRRGAAGPVPFGGFPWGRVAFGQPDGPLLPVAAVGGAPLLSFVAVLAGLALGEAAPAAPAGRGPRRRRRPRCWRSRCSPAAPRRTAPARWRSPGRTVTIAAVQGNVPRLGLDFNAQRRAVLDNHVRVTEQLAADVAAGRRARARTSCCGRRTPPTSTRCATPTPPRRSTGPPGPSGCRSCSARCSRGTRPGGTATATNSVLVWDPGVGVVDRTDKRRVQPFGEYLPWRPFFRLLSAYADRAGNFVPGTGAGAVDAAGVRSGSRSAGRSPSTTWSPTASPRARRCSPCPATTPRSGGTDMTYQQLAMSRVRAVEHDRAVLVVTTSGVSATIAPDGTVTAATSIFTPDVLVDATPLRATTTLAGRLRALPEWVLSATGLAGVGSPLATAGMATTTAHGARQYRDVRERTIMAEAGAGRVGGSGGTVLVVIPTYNERDNLEPRLARCTPPCPTPPCSSSTTAARTARASWRTRSQRTTRTCGSCTAP